MARKSLSLCPRCPLWWKNVLYGGMEPEFTQAGLLRAEAAALRDAGHEAPDWKRVEELLKESCEALLAGL